MTTLTASFTRAESATIIARELELAQANDAARARAAERHAVLLAAVEAAYAAEKAAIDTVYEVGCNAIYDAILAERAYRPLLAR